MGIGSFVIGFSVFPLLINDRYGSCNIFLLKIFRIISKTIWIQYQFGCCCHSDSHSYEDTQTNVKIQVFLCFFCFLLCVLSWSLLGDELSVCWLIERSLSTILWKMTSWLPLCKYLMFTTSHFILFYACVVLLFPYLPQTANMKNNFDKTFLILCHFILKR